jgi:hypothetical protein
MMWVPACLIYLGGIIGLLARWYGDDAAKTALALKKTPSQAESFAGGSKTALEEL